MERAMEQCESPPQVMRLIQGMGQDFSGPSDEPALWEKVSSLFLPFKHVMRVSGDSASKVIRK